MEKVLFQAWSMPPYQEYCDIEGYDERTGFEGQADFKKLVDADYAAFTEYLKARGLIK
jgi:hypothetical protein